MGLNVSLFPQLNQTQQMQQNRPAFGSLSGTIFNARPEELDPKVRADYVAAKELAEKADCLDAKVSDRSNIANALWGAAGVLPPLRRLGSLPCRLANGDLGGSAMQVGMMLANLPGDYTQMGLAGRNIKELFTQGFARQEFQREFGFFRGTFLEPLIRKYPRLEIMDKTLFDTKVGCKIADLFKIKINPDIDIAHLKGVTSKASKLPGVRFTQSAAQNVVGRSLLRTSVLGLFATSLMEVPAITKSVTDTEGSIIDKGKALCKQLCKSTGYVGILSTGIAVAGAIAFPYGVAAELAAMAIGSTLSLEASKALNKKIDSIF